VKRRAIGFWKPAAHLHWSKLHQAGETEAVLRRHAEAVLAVFEGSRRNEYVLSTQALLERYLPDLDNVRAALDWSAGAGGDAQLQIALAGAMAWIWVSAGHRPEGLRRTRAAMARIELSTPPIWRRGCWGRGRAWLIRRQGRRSSPPTRERSNCIGRLGNGRSCSQPCVNKDARCHGAHQPEQAELVLQEAARISETSWPAALRARLWVARSWVLFRQARFEEGMRVGEEILQMAIALDDQRMALSALIHLEQIEAACGRLEESVARGRDMARRIRHDRFLRSGIENIVLSNLSMSLTLLGEIDEALELARHAYPLVEQAGRVLDLLDPYALLALKRGRIDDAARLLGRADMRIATGTHRRELVEQKLHDELMRSLRAALSPDELSRLMKEGEALSDEEGARLALRE